MLRERWFQASYLLVEKVARAAEAGLDEPAHLLAQQDTQGLLTPGADVPLGLEGLQRGYGAGRLGSNFGSFLAGLEDAPPAQGR